MSFIRAKVLVAAFILMVGGVVAASAQPAAGSSVKGNIPLSFVVNGKTFSPGHYTISRASQYGNMSPYAMMIRGDDGRSAIFSTIATGDYSEHKQSVLTFDRVDGQYYLTGIIFKGRAGGVEVVTGTEIKRSIAMDRSTHRHVVDFSDVGR